jgi:oxygen-independent coproporphyrinogen III oxidase
LQAFTEAGYRYIGMDHFAKPDDELSVALDQGQLHRNFMGYTVQHGQLPSDLYGFGVSAISGLQGHFAQSWRKLSQYYDAIDAKQLPTMRGYVLSNEDRLRQQVILAILCQGKVHYPAFEAQFGISFESHFKESLLQLQQFEADGLVEFLSDGFTVTPTGRLFSRNIAMPFDAYLKQMNSEKPTFSKTV